jgi:hypothetical protein
MRTKNHGKYTNMSKNKPRAIARCDYSGLMVQHSSLIRQMEYRGKGLVWTGYLVNPKFADQPNPQNLTPRIKLDPVPISNARPDNLIDAQNTLATSVGVLTLDVSGNSNVNITIDQFSNNGSFNFKGILTGNIIVYVPNLMNQFYANNLTTGPFTLGMQLIGNVTPPLIIPYASPTTLLGPLVGNTLLSLQFINS